MYPGLGVQFSLPGNALKTPILTFPTKKHLAIRDIEEDYAYSHLLTQANCDASPQAAAQAKALLASRIEEVIKEQDNPQLADKVKKLIMEKLIEMSFK